MTTQNMGLIVTFSQLHLKLNNLFLRYDEFTSNILFNT